MTDAQRRSRATEAFFGRRKGKPLRERQALHLETLLPELKVDLSTPVELVPAPSRRGAVAEPQEVAAVLVAPSRPGELLRLAESRRIAVARR